MNDITIRNAEGRDLEAITAIYREAVLNGTASYELDPPDAGEMTRRFAAIKQDGYPFFVAESAAGRVVGYAYASAFRARPAYRWSVENSVYVDPDAQGQGAGRTLLATLLRECERLGFRQMVAVIGGAENRASIALHKSLDFEMIGIFKGSGYKHGQWLDTVLMQKALGEGRTTAPDPDSYPGTLYRPAK